MIDLTRMSDGRCCSAWPAWIAWRSSSRSLASSTRQRVPAVGLEALRAVLGGEAQRRRAVERDVVVVVEVDQAAEAELAGERRGLGGDALHEVAVGDDRVDVVVLDLGPERLAQELLGHRHADAVGEALAERPGRDLDARRDVHAVALGVARGERAPLAEVLELVERRS